MSRFRISRAIANFGIGTLAAIALFLPRAALAQSAYAPPETTLRDDIVYTVHADGSYLYEETVAIRLNTAEAVADSGQAYIGYSGSLDSVKILDAYTLTPDHRRVEVLPAQIMDQAAGDDDGGPSFSDQKNRVIIFPALVPEAVIYYHYIKTVSKADFPGRFYTVENFDDDSAIVSSSVTILAPRGMALSFEADGLRAGAAGSAPPGQSKYVYVLKNLAAEAPEQDSVDTDDFSPRLAVSSFPNQAAVGAAYEARAADKARVSQAVQRLADLITAGTTDKRAQARELYDWVSENIRYVSVDLGDSGFVPNPDDQILAAGFGDCKDHVTLLKALLAAKGIASSGVLVNWDEAYWRPKIPLGDYNHIITYIPQFDLFADSTAEFAAFGVLPKGERGKQALITGAPGIPSRIVILPLRSAAVPDTARVTTSEILDADGTVTGTSTIDDTGRFELDDREFFSEVLSGMTQQAASQMMEKFNVQGSGDLIAGDPDDLAHHFGYKTTFLLPGYAAVPGPGTMPVPPGVPALNALAGLTHFAALPTRREPIPCLDNDTEEVTTLTLPAALHVKSLPAAVDVSNAIGSYAAKYALRGQTLTADRHLLLKPAGATCGPADYQNIRAISFAIGRDFRATISY